VCFVLAPGGRRAGGSARRRVASPPAPGLRTPRDSRDARSADAAGLPRVRGVPTRDSDGPRCGFIYIGEGRSSHQQTSPLSVASRASATRPPDAAWLTRTAESARSSGPTIRYVLVHLRPRTLRARLIAERLGSRLHPLVHTDNAPSQRTQRSLRSNQTALAASWKACSWWPQSKIGSMSRRNCHPTETETNRLLGRALMRATHASRFGRRARIPIRSEWRVPRRRLRFLLAG
jgi:hypothetical protein